MPADASTTVETLKTMVREFVDERDWHKFHTPKNLSMAMAIEVAELMEHFQWLTPDESRAVESDAAKLSEVGEELADVLCYAMAIANELNLDITDIMKRKMVKNREKYPVEEIKGRYGHDDPGPSSAPTP